MSKGNSRPKRWADAAGKAEAALQELVDLQAEYQEWLDGLPENLQAGSLADKLNEVTGLDLESALNAVQEASGTDLPLGFGRD